MREKKGAPECHTVCAQQLLYFYYRFGERVFDVVPKGQNEKYEK